MDYYFLSHGEFMQAVTENRFVEWEEVYKGTCYGTLRSEVERIWAKGHVIVFDVDVVGGINLKRIFGDDACSVFIMPPSVEELRRRLEGRGTDAPEVIDRRVAKAEFELTKAPSSTTWWSTTASTRPCAARAASSTNSSHGRMKRVMLYFGSFNPVHRGHIALAEYVVGQGLCDEAVLVVSPQSPYKQAAELAPEMDRFEMAEIACAASKYPERIKPSVVEFLLPKPSYTIDTLRYLKKNFGSGMQFSILMGSDQIARLAGWKEYEQILEYPVYVYPRRGEPAEGFEGRITPLTDAPLQDFASTDVRDRIGRGEDVAAMLDEGVAAYIRRKGLWSPATRIAALGAQIAAEPGNTALLVERGKLHYRMGEWGPALNDFNAALRIDDTHVEAKEFARMVQEILEFRYKDIYNP